MTADLVDVCLVADLWEPAFSGAALRFKRYLPGLEALGIRVNVLTATPVATAEKQVQAPVGWMEASVGTFLATVPEGAATVDRVRLPDQVSFRRDRIFDWAIARHVLRTRPAVCHFLNLSALRSVILPRLHGAGVASVFTGTLLAELSPNPVRRFLQRERLRIPMSRAQHVVASSEVMREFFVSLGVRTPVSIVPNGVNTRHFRPPTSAEDKRALRSRLNVKPDAEMIVFIGSVIPRKGIDLLLEAFALVAAERPRAELFIIGPQPDPFDPEAAGWIRRIEELRLNCEHPAKIHFIGVSDEVDVYLRAADLLVFPSRREGMGNVVLEAMASGLTSILTPYLGLPGELGRAGHEYVLVEHNADSIGRETVRLLSMPQRREAIGRAAREWVVREQAVGKSLDAYACLYRLLARGSPARTSTSWNLAARSD